MPEHTVYLPVTVEIEVRFDVPASIRNQLPTISRELEAIINDYTKQRFDGLLEPDIRDGDKQEEPIGTLAGADSPLQRQHAAVWFPDGSQLPPPPPTPSSGVPEETQVQWFTPLSVVGDVNSPVNQTVDNASFRLNRGQW